MKGASGYDIVTLGHVEGHAAAIMRKGDYGRSALYQQSDCLRALR
jgi:hypothetical protein